VHNPAHHHADLASPNDASRLSIKLESKQSIEAKVSLAHSVVGVMRFAIERLDQGDCILGDAMGE